MFLSNGSPGRTCQWSKIDRQKAWPIVCIRRSDSKPIASIHGIVALMMCNGVPDFGVSDLTVPLLLAKTVYTASRHSEVAH